MCFSASVGVVVSLLAVSLVSVGVSVVSVRVSLVSQCGRVTVSLHSHCVSLHHYSSPDRRERRSDTSVVVSRSATKK